MSQEVFQVSLEQVYFGFKKDIKWTQQVLCSKCKGSRADGDDQIVECKHCKGKGYQQTQIAQNFWSFSTCNQCTNGKYIKKQCTQCFGRGYTSETKTQTLHVPPGITDDNFRMRVEGTNLFVYFKVKPHETFHRRGSDLIFVKKISLKESLLGTEFFVDHLDNNKNQKITLTEITKHGDSRTINGIGFPILNNPSDFGNLIIYFAVEFPTSLSNGDKLLLWDALEEESEKGNPIFDTDDAEEIEEEFAAAKL